MHDRTVADTSRTRLMQVLRETLRSARFPAGRNNIITRVCKEISASQQTDHVLRSEVSTALKSALERGEIGIRGEEVLVQMDQIGRMRLAWDRSTEFIRTDDFQAGAFGLSTAADVINRSIMASGGSTNYNYPFNLSVYAMTGKTLRLLATNDPSDPLHKKYNRETGFEPSGFIQRIITSGETSKPMHVELNPPVETIRPDDDVIYLFREHTSGAPSMFVMPLWHNREFQGIATINRRYGLDDLFHPSDLLLSWNAYDQLAGNLSGWGNDLAMILSKARLYEKDSGPVDPSRYLSSATSRVVGYDRFQVETIRDPGKSLGLRRERVVTELSALVSGILQADMRDIVERQYLGPNCEQLFVAREGNKVVGFSCGVKIRAPRELPSDLPVLYFAGTYVLPEARKRLLHVFMNGLFVSTCLKPFWVVARTAVPEVWDAIESFTTETYPAIPGKCGNGPRLADAIAVARETAAQTGIRLSSDFVASDVYPRGVRFETTKGDPRTVGFFGRTIDRWDGSGTPKGAIFVTAYIDEKCGIEYFDGMTVRQVLGNKKKAGNT